MKKVFCIGFHKTGTTSLAQALQILGYSVTGPNGVRDPNIAHNVYMLVDSLVNQYDAFQDNPWPLVYKYLDNQYPGSRFILTVRESDSWLASQVKHFGQSDTPMRMWIYGVGHPKGNETIYRERFERHHKEVLAYFQNRPNDFLVLNFADMDGWEKLCAFLDVEIPDVPFPHANSAGDRGKLRNRLRRVYYKTKKMIAFMLSHIPHSTRASQSS